MTSDIEGIVRNGLRRELVALVPDDIVMERRFGGSPDRARMPARGHRFDGRWQWPLLAAAVVLVALVTVTLVRQSPPSGPTPTAASPASADHSFVLVGPDMSDLLRGRAVALLHDWDKAAPKAPTLTRFDNSKLSGTASGVDVNSIQVRGRTLTLTFIGSSVPKNQNCGYSYTASALVSIRAIAVVVQADPGTWPGGPNVGCPLSAKLMTVRITLPQDVGTRAVVDVSTGQVLT